MNILFVKSPKIGSRILRWGLGEDVSHVVIEFDGKYHQFFHSYGKGLQALTPKEYDSHKYTIVHSLELYSTHVEECDMQDMFYDRHRGIRYDWPAFAYFTWRAVLRKFFDIPLPKENRWARQDMNLCTEALYLAADVFAEVTGFSLVPEGVDLAMITPEDAYVKMSQTVRRISNEFTSLRSNALNA